MNQDRCPWLLRADSGWEVFRPSSGGVVMRCRWRWVAAVVAWVLSLDYDVMQ